MKSYFNTSSIKTTTLATSMAILISVSMQATATVNNNQIEVVTKNKLDAKTLNAITRQDLENPISPVYNTRLTAEILNAITRQELDKIAPKHTKKKRPPLTAKILDAITLQKLKKIEKMQRLNIQGGNFRTLPSVLDKQANKKTGRSQTTITKKPSQKLSNNQLKSTQAVVTQTIPSNLVKLNDGIIAVVNNRPILQSQLQQTIKRLKNMYISAGKQAPTQSELKDQALKQLIVRELQLNKIRKLGIRPSNRDLQNTLTKYAKEQGASSLLDLQKKMEAKQRGSYALLSNALAKDLAIKTLQQSQISKKVRITNNDIKAFLTSTEGQMLNKNSYKTLHIRVPFVVGANSVNKTKALTTAKIIQNDLRLASNTTDENLARIVAKAQKSYPIKIQGGNMGYHKPDTLPAGLATTIVNLNMGQVIVVQTDLGIDVVKLTGKKVVDNLLIPQWQTRHILVAFNPYQNAEMSQYKINQIYNKLATGRDFAELASTYSNDPSSAGKGGSLGWVSEGSMVPEFEKVMKQTNTGKFSKPFKTQFGWHILQVVDTRKFDASKDVRRNMAKEILFKREAPQVREEWLEELKNSSYVRIIE